MSVKNALDDFGKYLAQQSRTNLTKKGHNDTSKLYKSFKHSTKEFKNSFSFSFFMEEYGNYLNEGVRGVGGVRKTTSKFNSRNNKGKLWKIKAKTSRFKFKASSGGISPKHFVGWAKRKGLSEFAVAKAVYHQGIETTNFLTNAFNNGFKRLPDELVEAYGLEVDDFLRQAVK